MTDLEPARIRAPEPGTFLTAAEVPPDLLRLRPGTAVRLLRLRHVVRVGYRLRADEVSGEAAALLRGPEGRDLCRAWSRLLAGAPDASGAAPSPAALSAFLRSRSDGWLPEGEERDLAWALARALVARRRFGGPERGVWVEAERPAREVVFGVEVEPRLRRVDSVRCARLGTRYGPSGSGEDYEDGGLDRARTVVLVRLDGGAEVLSGDLERACACGAALSEERQVVDAVGRIVPALEHRPRCPRRRG